MALSHGFAHVAYRPQMLQADNGAQMQQGVIGLARWPREQTDWGALRAWGWGASMLREELARDARINPERISLQGHSRFGKGVLVAAAFDHALADANVSSSGAGGAKLMRRDFGETLIHRRRQQHGDEQGHRGLAEQAQPAHPTQRLAVGDGRKQRVPNRGGIRRIELLRRLLR